MVVGPVASSLLLDIYRYQYSTGTGIDCQAGGTNKAEKQGQTMHGSTESTGHVMSDARKNGVRSQAFSEADLRVAKVERWRVERLFKEISQVRARNETLLDLVETLRVLDRLDEPTFRASCNDAVRLQPQWQTFRHRHRHRHTHTVHVHIIAIAIATAIAIAMHCIACQMLFVRDIARQFSKYCNDEAQDRW